MLQRKWTDNRKTIIIDNFDLIEGNYFGSGLQRDSSADWIGDTYFNDTAWRNYQLINRVSKRAKKDVLFT